MDLLQQHRRPRKPKQNENGSELSDNALKDVSQSLLKVDEQK